MPPKRRREAVDDNTMQVDQDDDPQDLGFAAPMDLDVVEPKPEWKEPERQDELAKLQRDASKPYVTVGKQQVQVGQPYDQKIIAYQTAVITTEYLSDGVVASAIARLPLQRLGKPFSAYLEAELEKRDTEIATRVRSVSTSITNDLSTATAGFLKSKELTTGEVRVVTDELTYIAGSDKYVETHRKKAREALKGEGLNATGDGLWTKQKDARPQVTDPNRAPGLLLASLSTQLITCANKRIFDLSRNDFEDEIEAMYVNDRIFVSSNGSASVTNLVTRKKQTLLAAVQGVHDINLDNKLDYLRRALDAPEDLIAGIPDAQAKEVTEGILHILTTETRVMHKQLLAWSDAVGFVGTADDRNKIFFVQPIEQHSHAEQMLMLIALVARSAIRGKVYIAGRKRACTGCYLTSQLLQQNAGVSLDFTVARGGYWPTMTAFMINQFAQHLGIDAKALTKWLKDEHDRMPNMAQSKPDAKAKKGWNQKFASGTQNAAVENTLSRSNGSFTRPPADDGDN